MKKKSKKTYKSNIQQKQLKNLRAIAAFSPDMIHPIFVKKTAKNRLKLSKIV